MKWFVMAVCALVVAACGGGGAANPQQPAARSGELDTSYGTGGTVVFQASEQMSDATFDATGNAYVAGNSVRKLDRSGARVNGYGGPANPPERSPALGVDAALFTVWQGGLVKRDMNGLPAPAFGDAGRRPIAWSDGTPAVPDRAWSVHRDSAGNLVVVGQVLAFNTAFHVAAQFIGLAKVDGTGQFVAGYGINGRKLTGINFHQLYPAVASTLDAQGNLVIAGRLVTGSYLVQKLDPSGEPLTTFAQGGSFVAPSCGTAEPSDVAVATGPAGEVYLGVSCEGAPTIFKVDAQGNLVGTFGSAGRAAGFFANGGSIGALLAAPDGSLYVAGAVAATQCKQLAVAKLSAATGTALASFGANGVSLPNVVADDTAKDLGLDSTGMLYVGAPSPVECPITGASRAYVIARLAG